MESPRACITTAVSLALLFIILGCGDKPGNADPNVAAQTLTTAAYHSYVRLLKTRKAGRLPSDQEVPESCWAREIRALHPIRVYLHRVNVVVVQRASGNVEEGKYISIPISSYVPQNGDDGFAFTNCQGWLVWDFKRDLVS